jgi:hypothetical protein
MRVTYSAWRIELFRSQLQRDLAEAAPDHHLEDVAVLERLGAAGAARELDHGLVAVEERQARQLAPVAVTVEETNVPAFAIGKRHKDAVHSWLRRGQLHGGIVGEKKAKICGSQRLFLHRDIALSSFWLVLPYADRLGCCGNSLARVGNVFR